MASALYKRRKELRGELSLIEKQIYDLETTYLEETKEFGNIFIGWSTYLSKERPKARPKISNSDRLFSLSSVTSPASRREDVKGEGGTGTNGVGVGVGVGGGVGIGGGIGGGNGGGGGNKTKEMKKKRKVED